jgi:hypothetical protein
MKNMKKLIIVSILILIGLIGFSQVAPSSQVRVANATTPFGINISIGTTVYDITADKYFVCKTASASTLTLTTGSANFTQVGGAGLGGTVTSVTSDMYLLVDAGTTIPHITANVGIAKDSLVKMDSLATSGQWAKFGTKGLVGRSSASIYSEIGVKTAKIMDFEAADDSLSHCHFDLALSPVATAISVQLNGMNLKPTDQYTIVGTKIRIGTSVYKYDKIQVIFTY